MYFKVSEWPYGTPCPVRLVDPATDRIIMGVTEFNDDEGWCRVLCRGPEGTEGRRDFPYRHNDTDTLVTQVLTVPFKVVPYQEGIDEKPGILLDTMTYNGGDPVDPWIPAGQPYQHGTVSQ
jgi:hypothetical protein